MLRLLYNALWYPVLPFALAFSGALADPGSRRARMGTAWSGAAPGSRRVWAHAASVGEVEALRGILSGIRDARPEIEIIITTMTAAGRDAARRRIPGAQAWLLAPFDNRRAIVRFLSAVRPALVLIAETELWPNYFIQSRAAGARVAIVNGRLSEPALGRYRRVRPLIAEAIRCADLILAQTEDDAGRFIELGADPGRVKVTGNTKFDIEALTPPPLREHLAAFASAGPLMVAGSTAHGEDQIIVDAYRELKTRFADLSLVLAPRHPERAGEIERILRAAKLGYLKASQIDGSAANGLPVLLLDTMGELRAMYGRACIAFVGGSLMPGRGGQSLAEPAAASVPVIFGPFHENQRAAARLLIEAGAGAVVSDAAELARAATVWLGDAAARLEAGARARHAVERMAGGTAASLMHLRELISFA